jgi:cytochrome c peroxidase
MSKFKKRLIIVTVIVVLLLAMPVSNLIGGGTRNSSIASIKSDDDTFAQARDVLSSKCADCHAEDYALPLYAFLPGARNIIEQDIQAGLETMDLARSLQPGDGEAVSEVVIAKLEQSFVDGSMPPKPYLALHWNGLVSDTDRESVLAWTRSVRAAHYATGTAEASFADHMLQPVPDSVDADPAKVALGNKLFHDARLSGDNTVSCATCHALDKGGTDRLQYSVGVGDAVGGINSPTVFNAGLLFAQFWDGRATTLAEQADGPVNNPIEMACNWDEVCAKLNQDPGFVAEFNAVYPDGFSKDAMIDAIATFESTLVTPNSKFDRYLKGDADAMTAQEVDGFHVFQEFGCATCHVGQAMGGQSYEKMGRKKDYFAGRALTDADNGRFNVTKNEADRHRFKTPTLRNIALTAPYFHDGSTSDLSEVILIMAEYQAGRTMSTQQVASVEAFLNAQTGEYQGALLQ